MAESYSVNVGGVASGTDKSMLNVYDAAATPTRRFRIFELTVGSVATPADQAAKFKLARTTAIGTPAGTFTPVNLDAGGPAGECSCGQGVYSVEPTYTSNKELLLFSVNQRATFRWVANPGKELVATATQNNGLGLKSSSSTSTQAYESCILFEE